MTLQTQRINIFLDLSKVNFLPFISVMTNKTFYVSSILDDFVIGTSELLKDAQNRFPWIYLP